MPTAAKLQAPLGDAAVWSTELFLNHNTTFTTFTGKAEKQKTLDHRNNGYIRRAAECLQHLQKARIGLVCVLDPAGSADRAAWCTAIQPLEAECKPDAHPSIVYKVWSGGVFSVPQIKALGGHEWASNQCVPLIHANH